MEQLFCKRSRLISWNRVKSANYQRLKTPNRVIRQTSEQELEMVMRWYEASLDFFYI